MSPRAAAGRRPAARVLTVNSGSSSVRLALVEVQDGTPRTLARRHAEAAVPEPRALVEALLAEARSVPDVVAHRIVHGGGGALEPELLDARVEERIAELVPLAPLHLPAALRWIGHTRAVLGPGTRHLALFDSAYFAGLPEAAATYALPRALLAATGVRRLGFHGFAHAALARRWRALHPELDGGGRWISLQLGAGCSAAAVARGRPLDTSMGFTPGEGLVMATRSGDVDPGLVTYLQRARGWSAEETERVLAQESGWLGLAGEADMRALLASPSPAARLALEVFVHRARKYVGAYLALLGGAEGVLFGGGIGEHAPELRARILERLEPLGIELDAGANARATAGEARLSAPGSAVEVWALSVDEEAELAREAWGFLERERGARTACVNP